MFSVVIPLYNKAHTIRNTLESVFAQTYQDFEVIIVDDGSSDKSVAVVQSLKNDARVKIIYQENQGVSVARNNGVRAAKFEHIAFLDGDDEWLPLYLEKMKESIELFSDAGMYCCAGYGKNSSEESLRLAKKYEGKITSIDFFENPHVFAHISATIVKKTAFNKVQGFPVGMKKNEDFVFLFSVALLEKVVYCGYPLSIYLGDVPGQATEAKADEGYNFKDVANRFGLCNRVWRKSSKNKSHFLTFERYEIRHIIFVLIRKNEYDYLERFVRDLEQDVLTDFSSAEIFLWKCKSLKLFAILHIYTTKVIWRLHGFPVVR